MMVSKLYIKWFRIEWHTEEERAAYVEQTLLQRHSVSLAWRLDWEMRRRLILYKTGFTGLRFFIYFLPEQCRVFFRIFTFYLFLNWFSMHVSDNPKYVCGRRLYACINTWKFKGLDYIIARHQKSDLHGTSFQSSPKINCVLITRPIYMQWNFTTPTITDLLIKVLTFFRPLSSVHLFQSNQCFQEIEFMERHITEIL